LQVCQNEYNYKVIQKMIFAEILFLIIQHLCLSEKVTFAKDKNKYMYIFIYTSSTKDFEILNSIV